MKEHGKLSTQLLKTLAMQSMENSILVAVIFIYRPNAVFYCIGNAPDGGLFNPLFQKLRPCRIQNQCPQLVFLLGPPFGYTHDDRSGCKKMNIVHFSKLIFYFHGHTDDKHETIL
jgi:hypothetical protein